MAMIVLGKERSKRKSPPRDFRKEKFQVIENHWGEIVGRTF